MARARTIAIDTTKMPGRNSLRGLGNIPIAHFTATYQNRQLNSETKTFIQFQIFSLLPAIHEPHKIDGAREANIQYHQRHFVMR